MTGYQFCHINLYASSASKIGGSARNVRDILSEADRLEGYASHVSDPKPATVLFGMPPSEILDFHDEKIKRVGKGRGKGKGLRKDSPTLVAAVFSFPYPPAEKTDANYIALRDESIAFFQREIEGHGGVVLGAVEHDDEEYLHFHIYAMDVDDPKLSAKNLHRGHVAEPQSGRRGRRESPNSTKQ